MKRFRRVLSILLSGAILCTTGLFSATAAEQEQPQPYTITYQAEEITDTDALLDLAVEQAQRKSMARGALSAPGQEEITVTQLLETRRYADGTEEHTSVTRSLLLLEEEEKGNPDSLRKVRMSELRAARAPGSDSTGQAVGRVYATVALYYNFMNVVGETTVWVRADEATAMVMYNATPYTVQSCGYGWRYKKDFMEMMDYSKYTTVYPRSYINNYSLPNNMDTSAEYVECRIDGLGITEMNVGIEIDISSTQKIRAYALINPYD